MSKPRDICDSVQSNGVFHLVVFQESLKVRTEVSEHDQR